MNHHRLSNLSVLGLFLVLFPVCYASVLTVSYGFSDDYFDIVAGPEGGPITKKILEGRPLYALITKMFLYFTTDIDDLRYIRFGSILGIALVAWSVFLALVRSGWNRVQSFCVGVVIGTTLPFQLYAAWATAAPFPFAALISGLAFFVGERALDARSPFMKYLLAAAASLILLAALAIYQPAAMFFWVFVAITVLRPNASTCHTVRSFGWYCMIGLTGFFLAFIVYKSGTILHPNLPVRPTLDFQHVPAKVVWFLTHVSSRSLRFAWLHPDITFNMFTSLIVLVFMAGGGILYLRGTHKEFSVRSAIAVFLLPLSYIPNLVAAENVASYRSLSSLSSLIVIYMFFAFLGMIGRLRHFRFHLTFANVVMGSIAICCVVMAAYQVRVFIAVPQCQELEFMRSHFSKESLSRAQSIYVIRPWWNWPTHTPAPFVQGEFGSPSSHPYWNPPPMAFLLLREMFPEYAHIPVQSVDSNDVIDPPPDSLVVDMRDLGKAGKLFQGACLSVGAAIDEMIRKSELVIRRDGYFDVYRSGNKLIYVGSQATDPVLTDIRFFLHLIPVDVDDLPDHRKQYGFDNLDFRFDDYKLPPTERAVAGRDRRNGACRRNLLSELSS